VRTALLELQRKARRRRGVVVEGRDTGTVVFRTPMRNSSCSRARRSARAVASPSWPQTGQIVDFDVTLREIRERDQRDASRDVAPMVPAPDAVLVDSSTQTLEQVVDSLATAAEARAKRI